MANLNKNIKEAIILAGGKGTRLQSVVSNVPKPMALIGESLIQCQQNWQETFFNASFTILAIARN